MHSVNVFAGQPWGGAQIAVFPGGEALESTQMRRIIAKMSLRAGTHTFTVERGFDATRKSLLQAEFDKREQGGLTLRVGGQMVQVIQGTLSLPD